MQVNEARLREILQDYCPDNVSIEACDKKECCIDCKIAYIKEVDPAPTETPPMIKLVSDQLFNARNACK